jgi:hypothetical protein
MSSSDLWSAHRSALTGVWKCVSFEFHDTSGPEAKLIAKPHGDSPLGRVQISHNAYLSAHVVNPDRMKGPLPSGKTMQEGGDAEVAHVARGWSMYFGHFELFEDEEGLFWRTKVEISSDPGIVGGIQERRVGFEEVDGRRLMVLRPTGEMTMEVCSAFFSYLCWAWNYWDERLIDCLIGWEEGEGCFEMGED